MTLNFVLKIYSEWLCKIWFLVFRLLIVVVVVCCCIGNWESIPNISKWPAINWYSSFHISQSTQLIGSFYAFNGSIENATAVVAVCNVRRLHLWWALIGWFPLVVVLCNLFAKWPPIEIWRLLNDWLILFNYNRSYLECNWINSVVGFPCY